MKTNFFASPRRVHCVGIGGIGLSALAQLLHHRGFHISGSDQETSLMTKKLESIGIEVFRDHTTTHFKKNYGIDLVIRSLAIGDDNEEIKKARALGIPVITYPEALGEITRSYLTISICGTHGKSTTTAMISKVLMENGFDPTVIVGATLREFGNNNFKLGKSKLLVIESCEYKRAFLHYRPRIIVMHTLDADHFDYYSDAADYLSAFKECARLLPRDGYFFGNLDDEDIHEIFHELQLHKFPTYNTFTYGIHYSQGDFSLQGNNVFQRGRHVGNLQLQVQGAHNRSNALAAFAVCATVGIVPRDIFRSLNSYLGASRRFEYKGALGRTTVIDDYAHHPAEIKATLQAAREIFPKAHICVVFQPHQYNRTRHFLKEFGSAFDQVNFVIIPNIYEVRDTKLDMQAVSTKMLVDEIKKNHIQARDGKGLEKTAEWLKKHVQKFDVIITIGAGDVWKIAEAIL